MPPARGPYIATWKGPSKKRGMAEKLPKNHGRQYSPQAAARTVQPRPR